MEPNSHDPDLDARIAYLEQLSCKNVGQGSFQDFNLSKFKTYALRAIWYVGTVRMVQGYGAAGAVVRCKGCSGYSGGVRWVQWRGAVGTVEGCGGYSGGVRWVQWRGAMGTVEGCGGYSGRGRWVQWRGAVGIVGRGRWVQWRGALGTADGLDGGTQVQ